MKAILVVLLVSVTLVAVHGRSTGAPADACDTLTPGHGGTSMSNSPFGINMDQFEIPPGSGEYYYTPGMTYTLRLEDANNSANTFRGFFVQCRSILLGDARVGAFGVINSADSQLGPCARGNSSITHTNNNDKTFMMMTWTAPDEGTGPIEFAYAVVQVFSTYWADIRGPELQEIEETTVTPTTIVTDECPECGENAFCSPNTGYECECHFGFTGNAYRNCTDIDECQSGICDNYQVCINTPGSVVCDCLPGYFYNVETSECEVVSNCTYAECGRNEQCIVTDDGSEVCICNDGYVFDPNTYYCELGDPSLPIRLAPTVIEYSGPCSQLDIDEYYNQIGYTINQILESSIVYSNNVRT